MSLIGDSIWITAIAGGLALGAMMLLRMPHSPAAATAIIAVTTDTNGWLFIGLAAAAAAILVLVGTVGNKINRSNYPSYIW